MSPLDLDKVRQFVSENIVRFHRSKADTLARVDLTKILRSKNPYLFRAKNIELAADLVGQVMDAYLSSSEEKLFGDFLEDLAVFIAQQTFGGWKSAATGIDLEFRHNNIHYLVSVKSGPRWGNSSQQKKQEQDFKTAVKVIRQSRRSTRVEPVLGICYGKTKTTFVRGYMKVVGQNFWYLISGNEHLYTDIIEPLGHKAKQHNSRFTREKNRLLNRFTEEFMAGFCRDGGIDWKKLVEFNSGNLDLKD